MISEFEYIMSHITSKKICLITSFFPPYPKNVDVVRGGIDIGLENLIRKLEEIGIETIIITQDYLRSVEKKDDVYRIRKYVPYTLISNSLKRGLLFAINEIFNINTFLKILTVLKKKRPDCVLIGATYQLSMASLIAPLILSIPMYIRYDWICPSFPKEEACFLGFRLKHCGDCMEMYSGIRYRKSLKIIFGLLSYIIVFIKIRLWNLSKKIFAVNSFSKDLYICYGVNEKKIVIVAPERELDTNPMIDHFFGNLRNENEFIVSYIGRLSPEKGISLLLDSFEQVSKKNKRIKLLIAGDDFFKKSILERINQNSSIKYLGWLDKNKLSQLYAISDVIVIPSIVPEGYPITASEAMLFSKKILSFNLGGMKEIMKRYPMSYPIDVVSSTALAEAILKLMSD